jgi:hypothetical protein
MSAVACGSRLDRPLRDDTHVDTQVLRQERVEGMAVVTERGLQLRETLRTEGAHRDENTRGAAQKGVGRIYQQAERGRWDYHLEEFIPELGR